MPALISKALRYDPCVARDHTVLPATHTQTIPAFTPQPQGITVLWPVPTCTAWWTEAHRCEKLAQGFYAVYPAETRTHDLSIASPILCRQRHYVTGDFRDTSAWWVQLAKTLKLCIFMVSNVFVIIWSCWMQWKMYAAVKTLTCWTLNTKLHRKWM